MAILDCESYDSALASISDAYGVSSRQVASFLQEFDVDKAYRGKTGYGGSHDYLKDVFESSFGTLKWSVEKVCWFHLTRVTADTDFSEGILPLDLVLPKIWKTVISIPADPRKRANLNDLSKKGVPDFQYELKTNDRLHFGPYATLVKEFAFHADALGNHGYLHIPEIIEDICNGYEQEFGESIYEEISAALRKCIVKFESGKDTEDYLIPSSLLYCWCKPQRSVKTGQ